MIDKFWHGTRVGRKRNGVIRVGGRMVWLVEMIKNEKKGIRGWDDK